MKDQVTLTVVATIKRHARLTKYMMESTIVGRETVVDWLERGLWGEISQALREWLHGKVARSDFVVQYAYLWDFDQNGLEIVATIYLLEE